MHLGLLLEVAQHAMRILDIGIELGIGDVVADQRLDIAEGFDGIVGMALGAGVVAVGNPDAAARRGGGAAEFRRLFHHQHACAGVRRGEGCGQPARTRADDEQIDFLIRCHGKAFPLLFVGVVAREMRYEKRNLIRKARYSTVFGEAC